MIGPWQTEAQRGRLGQAQWQAGDPLVLGITSTSSTDGILSCEYETPQPLESNMSPNIQGFLWGNIEY